jgi:hypothetical protein
MTSADTPPECTPETSPEESPRPRRSLRVRIAAARAAVAASEKTGRPVDPRVKELAEMYDRYR